MSLPRWIEVNLNTVLVPDAGWHHDDDGTMRKLAASLQRHGQLEPLVVRGDPDDDSMCTLVRGHKLLGAMLSLGWTKAMAVHVGALDPMAALRVALHLELRFEVDYAALSDAVCQLVAAGATPAELASGSPFDEDRIRHFMTLRTWDWSQFRQDDGQARLDWDALVAEAPLAVVAEGAREAAQVAGITPVVAPAAALPPAEAMHGYADQFSGSDFPALEDVTELHTPAEPAAPAPVASPAAPAAPRPQASEPAPATAGEAAATPQAATKAKPAKGAAKVPKAPDAQLGLF